jgi:hypothetical protein
MDGMTMSIVLIILGIAVLGISIWGVIRQWPKAAEWGRSQRTPFAPAAFSLFSALLGVGVILIVVGVAIP